MNRSAVKTVAKPGRTAAREAGTAMFCGRIWIIDYLGINNVGSFKKIPSGL